MAVAASTALEEFKKSKRACLCCKEKALFTNDNEKVDDDMHHLCFNCGYEYSDNEQLREYRDSKDKDDDQNPWNEGFMVLVAMLAVILTIHLNRLNNFQETQSPQTQIHQVMYGQKA